MGMESWEHTGEQGWDHIGEKDRDHVGEQGWDHIGEQGWDHIGDHHGWSPDDAQAPTVDHNGQLNSTWGVPYLDHLGDDCFASCLGVTGKCPTDFCGTGGWCCRWGLEWDTPGCYNVGCHGKHCCAKQGDFRTLDVMV